ncbi:DUF6090 family protein [Algoriphagus namhaensis]|uniref:DUF6090 family protein n=1 Tax=Algoriphagus namhaensis TaxID=915353 RepID=A0ABV8ASE9_9BACT
MLYAIGEIFLVVIGIIIAVNINNWNEQRKAKTQEIKTLKELKSALQADLVDIEFNINWHESARNACEIILEVIDKKIPYTDSLAYHFGSMTRFSQFLPDLGTYETIKASGLGLITNDSLRLEAAHYYENDIKHALGYEAINRSLFPLNMEIYRKHFYVQELLNSGIPKNYDALINDDVFISYLFETKGLRENEVRIFSDLVVKCKGLINLIDQELKKE